MVNAFPLNVSVVRDAFSIFLNISSSRAVVDMPFGIVTVVDVIPIGMSSTTNSACTKVGNGLPDNVTETHVLCLSHQLEYFVRVLQVISNRKHVEDAT